MTLPTLYIISGGLGTGAERIARATLVQFPSVEVPIEICPHIRSTAELDAIVARAVTTNGMLIHTLVDTDLRNYLLNTARDHSLIALDLQGPLLLQLTKLLGQEPAGEPGRYEKLRAPYFKRIEAMEFTIDHDDGRRVEELHLAEIVLTGVSRVGKTPLSMYLSTQGWRVANVPLVVEVPPPPKLFEIDKRRVIGLTIEPGQLVAFRQFRQKRLGLSLKNNYASATDLYEEVEYAERIFRKGGFYKMNVTDRPIEESAEEIVAYILRSTAS